MILPSDPEPSATLSPPSDNIQYLIFDYFLTSQL
jgi:hypothetical protein